MAEIKITFKLFAALQDYLPQVAKKTNSLTLEIDDATTIAQVIERFNLPHKMVHLVLVDGSFIPAGERAERTLREGQTLAIWPPVAGG